KIGGHSVADVLPGFSRIVRAIQAPVVLEEEAFGPARVHHDFVYALSELRIFFGHELHANAPVAGAPGASSIVGSVSAARGNRDIHTLMVRGIGQNGVQAEAAVPGNPARPVRMIE